MLSANAQDNTRIATLDLTAAELAHYMAPGWNLGNTMEAGDNANNFTANGGEAAETSWQNTRTTHELIKLIKKKGFKTIRIPTAWVMGHLADKATMKIDEKWLKRVKELVDYSISENLYVELNDHWDGGWMEYDGFTTGANVEEKKRQLHMLWTNIANAFKDYDERLIFGGLNEPGVGGASKEAKGKLIFNQYADNDEELEAFSKRLTEYEQVFIDAVRATGGNNAKRVLVVSGPSVNLVRTYKYFDATKLKDSANSRLMVEVHHYDPYSFCQMEKDTEWGKTHYYWKGHAPKDAGQRSVAANMEDELKSQMKNLKEKFVDNGYPVLVGEYGCNLRNIDASEGDQKKHDESVGYWYNSNTMNMMSYGLIPVVWDTNSMNRPNMTIVDRENLKITNTKIYSNIMEGAKHGQKAYESIYPKP